MPRTSSPATAARAFPALPALSSTGSTRGLSGSVNGKPCSRKIGRNAAIIPCPGQWLGPPPAAGISGRKNGPK